MIKDILIDIGTDETRIAILEDGVVAEIQIEKNQEKSLVGNIYKGKVVRVLSGMQSAFVDIGLKKNAYLYVKDVIPVKYNNSDELTHSGSLPDISELLNQGQEINVQVIKDAIGEKGPRVSAHIAIPGRYTVFLPHGNTIGISKRIASQEERQRLREIVASVKSDKSGIIVRTSSESIGEALLTEEINTLSSLWESIQEKEKKVNSPELLQGEPGIIEHTIREHLSTCNRFIVNQKETYEKITSLLSDEAPGLKERVEYYNKCYDMFEYYNVQSALKEALSRKVWLKNGAYLVFDYTEAMTVVDVNSGKYVGKLDMEETVFKINIEAANALVRQIRLRNLSGIIIVDFIDMQKKEHREQLLQHLREAVKADRIQTVVVGMTSLGLVEMTRKKVRIPLSNHHSH
ncbi:MAG: Rne/Rng family ribonuclease [Clostridiaceae bacterium]|jgi:ribonuclease G|nr:Rne/Rng family ribonuclease [Clostridiaceae bacterium]